MKLTEEQVELFFEQGWLILPQVFTLDEMGAARRAFERLHARALLNREPR